MSPVHPDVWRRVIQTLSLSVTEAEALWPVVSSCINIRQIGPRIAGIRSNDNEFLFQVEKAFAAAERELLEEKNILKNNRGETAMTIDVSHISTRRLVVKEADPDFLHKNSIEVSPVATDSFFSGPIPSQLSLKKGMSRAKDQGSAGTCTSFGVVSCLDYFHGAIDLSEGHLTHGAEKQFGDCSEGLALEHAMAFATSTGVVTENDWKYDPQQICWVSPPDINGKQRYKFTECRVVFQRPASAVMATMNDILAGKFSIAFGASQRVAASVSNPMPSNFVNLLKAVLARASTPVAVSVPVWFTSESKLDAGWDFGPDVKMPTPVNLRVFLEQTSVPGGAGWHVISVCGYDDTTSRFEFKNSWSTWWGDLGFGTIPYEYITAYGRLAMHGWV